MKFSTTALARFVAQTDAFPTFVSAILPALFVLGWFTVVRLTDTTVENNPLQEAITHIRAYYRRLTPEAPSYFPTWQTSDEQGAEALAMLGTKPRRWTVLFTTASMVAAINGLIGGVGTALLINELLDPDNEVPAIVVGVLVGFGCLLVACAYQARRYSAAAAADHQRWAKHDVANQYSEPND